MRRLTINRWLDLRRSQRAKARYQLDQLYGQRRRYDEMLDLLAPDFAVSNMISEAEGAGISPVLLTNAASFMEQTCDAAAQIRIKCSHLLARIEQINRVFNRINRQIICVENRLKVQDYEKRRKAQNRLHQVCMEFDLAVRLSKLSP